MQVKNADDTDSCAGTCDGNGACKAKRGQTCNTVAGGCIGGSQCSPDGYCCDTACTGSCQACDLKGMQGMCLPVASGAPHGNRAACTSDGTNCGGKCTGKSDGSCDYPTGSCGDGPTCSGNMSVAQSMCKAGSCQRPTAQTCPLSLKCSGTECKTSCSDKNDCVGGLVCNDGKCEMAPQTTSITIAFDLSLSGSVSNKSAVNHLLEVGDFADNTDACGFVSFPLSTIPKGSVVKTATLTLYQDSVMGAPFDTLSTLRAEDVAYSALDKSAYDAKKSSVVSLPSDTSKGPRSVTVTSMVASDVGSGAANSQFRICFLNFTDNDDTPDFAAFTVNGQNKPTLVVTTGP